MLSRWMSSGANVPTSTISSTWGRKEGMEGEEKGGRERRRKGGREKRRERERDEGKLLHYTDRC